MIHMLSRFDLKPGVDPEQFTRDYYRLVEQMRAEGLVSGTGKVGRREPDPPMDTDEDGTSEYYAVMSFESREQLDQSYAFLLAPAANNATSHPSIMRSVENPVFTCWQDME